MHIVTPTEIDRLAWEGELVAPPVAMKAPAPRPVVASLGRPEVWSAAEALADDAGGAWTPPLGDAEFWLLRLACTLHRPAGRQSLVEAEQRLYLRPRDRAAGEGAAYAFSLFPGRLGVEDRAQFTASLGPGLKLGGAEVKTGEVGATIDYRKVYPVIQGYGAGEPAPYWVFKAHDAHPLVGSQFVYAVVAARAGAGGARASVELVVTVETCLGDVIRLGLPETAHAHLGFTIPL